MDLSQDGPGFLFCFSLLVVGGGAVTQMDFLDFEPLPEGQSPSPSPPVIPGTGSYQLGLVLGVGLLAILLRSRSCWNGQLREVGMC